MKEIRNYIYIDEQGIDSIYSQLHKETIAEMRTKQIKTNSGSLNIINGLIKGEHTSTTECDKLISLTHEQKISEIIKIVSKNKNYYTDLNKAISKNLKPSNGIIIVNIHDTFHSSLDFKSYDTYKNMLKSGYIQFEKGDILIASKTKLLSNYDTHNYRDDYYKQNRYKITMSMNLEKMRASYKGWTSHFSVALRGGDGNLSLGVFGQLRNINELFFQIKPFAVWW